MTVVLMILMFVFLQIVAVALVITFVIFNTCLLFPSRLIYIWSTEWKTLSQEFGCDNEIKIVKEECGDRDLFITPGMYQIL